MQFQIYHQLDDHWITIKNHFSTVQGTSEGECIVVQCYNHLKVAAGIFEDKKMSLQKYLIIVTTNHNIEIKLP